VILGKNVKLILLDSIASIVRKEFNAQNTWKRQEFLSKEASVLKYLAETFSIPVVIVNQVTSKKATKRDQLYTVLPRMFSYFFF
jgi:RAD51-like protein 1